ncbi:hypothetical protein E3N88_18452 [Mikania micrantha]|uniref:Uncharacterized protein n=1 Tax=Mikania micrantha TaxID=192012 RepID=A0A5N6NKG2_9ASTR|nr:hypothetical protein E3N88_18452 [Mikania micrantha]
MVFIFSSAERYPQQFEFEIQILHPHHYLTAEFEEFSSDQFCNLQFDLIKGDKIQATIKKVLMCAFENQLEEGSIILLSRFGVGEMNFKYHVIKHPFRGDVLGCTLWDNFAQQFSSFLSNNSTDQVVIVVIQFGKVKAWKGNPNIQNSLFGTRLFINEDVEEINTFKARFVTMIMPANCGEGSSQISSQTVYSSREEFLSRNVRKYVEEVFDLSKVL